MKASSSSSQLQVAKSKKQSKELLKIKTKRTSRLNTRSRKKKPSQNQKPRKLSKRKINNKKKTKNKHVEKKNRKKRERNVEVTNQTKVKVPSKRETKWRAKPVSLTQMINSNKLPKISLEGSQKLDTFDMLDPQGDSSKDPKMKNFSQLSYLQYNKKNILRKRTTMDLDIEKKKTRKLKMNAKHVSTSSSRNQVIDTLLNSTHDFFLQLFDAKDKQLIESSTPHAFHIMDKSFKGSSKEREKMNMRRDLLLSTFRMCTAGLNKKKIIQLKPYENYLMFNPFVLSQVNNLLEEYMMDSEQVSLETIENLAFKFHRFYLFCFFEEKSREMETRYEKKTISAKEKSKLQNLKDFIKKNKKKAFFELEAGIKLQSPIKSQQKESNAKNKNLKRVLTGSMFNALKFDNNESKNSIMEKSKVSHESELSKMINAKKVLKSIKTSRNNSRKSSSFLSLIKVCNQSNIEDSLNLNVSKKSIDKSKVVQALQAKGEKPEVKNSSQGAIVDDKKTRYLDQIGIQHSEKINKRIRKVDSKKNVNDVKIPYIKDYIDIKSEIKCPQKRQIVKNLNHLEGTENAQKSLKSDISFSQMSKEKTMHRKLIPSPCTQKNNNYMKNRRFRLREKRNHGRRVNVDEEINLVEDRPRLKKKRRRPSNWVKSSYRAYGTRKNKGIKKKKKKKLHPLGNKKKEKNISLYKRR